MMARPHTKECRVTFQGLRWIISQECFGVRRGLDKQVSGCRDSCYRKSVTASRGGELTGDRREDRLHLVAQPDQYRNGNDRDKGENQGVLDQSLSLRIVFTR
jgi:hypothetical protein